MVLDLGQERAAYCGKLLAELGADVIKIEPPQGDAGRRQAPFKADEPGIENSLPFAYYNSSKRGVTLDLGTRDGQRLLRLLAATADALVEGFEPGHLDGLGIGAQALAQANPGLVFTSLTAFGQSGPHRDYGANDLVAFASGGVMFVSGDAERPPVLAPGQQAYDLGSVHAAACTLMALWARRRTGRGQAVDVAMQEVLAIEEHTISRYAHEDYVIHRDGSQHESAAPGGLYPCRDGYIHLFITNSTAGIWGRFLEWIGSPEGLRDACWADAMYRRAHVRELLPHVAHFTMAFGKRELMQQAQERHIPCIAVNTPAELMDDPHVRERNFFVEMEHPSIGCGAYPVAPYRLSDTPAVPRWPAPLLGQHNGEVYCGRLGLTHCELSSLFQAGVI